MVIQLFKLSINIHDLTGNARYDLNRKKLQTQALPMGRLRSDWAVETWRAAKVSPSSEVGFSLSQRCGVERPAGPGPGGCLPGGVEDGRGSEG